MNIDEWLNLVPADRRDEAAEFLKNSHAQNLRGAIMRVMARNFSHGVSTPLCKEKTN